MRKPGPSGFLRVVALVATLTSGIQQTASGSIADLFGFGGDSGKIAKLEFRLRDSFDVTTVAWSPNGQYIATAGIFSNRIHIWDVKRRAIVKEMALEASGKHEHDLAWSPQGDYLAACAQEGLKVFATNTWALVTSFSGSHMGVCDQPVFSSDGRVLALLSFPTLERFEVAGWRLTSQLPLTLKLIHAIAYLPGTHTLLLAGGEYTGKETHFGRIWFLKADEVIPGRSILAYDTGAISGHGGDALSLAVSADGTRVATGTFTGAGYPPYVITDSVHILDVASGVLLGAPLDGVAKIGDAATTGNETGLAYTPDGRFIIVGYASLYASVIHLVDAKSFKVADTFHGSGVVYDIAVDPQGTEFAAGSGDQVIVWSLPR